MSDDGEARFRYRLTVEFDGTPFVGWQRQDNGTSVQGSLEAAGRALSGSHSPVVGAGRTDAGVHALAMTAHIDLARGFPADTVRDALNAHLRPAPIAITAASRAPNGFHARFSCIGRRYLYRILDRRAPTALDRDRVWQVPAPLYVSAMAEAAEALVGRHDFTTFRAAHCQASGPIRTLEKVEISREGREIHCALAAPSFLHNQVRSIVGTLVQVGLGRWPTARVGDVLHQRDRAACGPVAPARGLYFVNALYSDPPA